MTNELSSFASKLSFTQLDIYKNLESYIYEYSEEYSYMIKKFKENPSQDTIRTMYKDDEFVYFIETLSSLVKIDEFTLFINAAAFALSDHDKNAALTSIIDGFNNGVLPILALRDSLSIDKIRSIIASYLGYEYKKLSIGMVEVSELQNLHIEASRKIQYLPIKVDGSIALAVSDIPSKAFLDEAHAHFGETIPIYIAPEKDIESMRVNAANMQRFSGKINVAFAQDDATIVDSLLNHAVSMGASDIHIEFDRDPYSESMITYFRIDGKRTPITTNSPDNARALIGRIKIAANMNVAEHRQFQGGRFSTIIKTNGVSRTVDVRCTVQPVEHAGETREEIVLRLLMQGSEIKLEHLGFSLDIQEQLLKILQYKQNIILSTGPTGSGKTTTLYACLREAVTPELKAVSAEDPVEYVIPGVSQTQINEPAGRLFANSLREFVRVDPDIIFVGEIRDAETANLAIDAGVTGHLVFSSIHADDVASVIFRFIELGVQRTLLSSSIRGVLNQRLIRLLCPECKIPDKVENYPEIQWQNNKIPQRIYKAAENGCAHCHNIGYKNREPIGELLIVDRKIKQIIMNPSSSSIDVFDAARKNGMRTLWEDALLKMASGKTSYNEIMAYNTQELF